MDFGPPYDDADEYGWPLTAAEIAIYRRMTPPAQPAPANDPFGPPDPDAEKAVADYHARRAAEEGY